MTETTSVLPLIAVGASAVAVVPILLSRSRPNLREGWTFAAALVKFGVVLLLVSGVRNGTTYVTPSLQFVPGVELVLRVDALGALFALVASALWLVTCLYSVGYMRGLDEANQTRYFAAFAGSMSATIGVAFAGNLVTVLVAYELLTLATYPLVVHKRTTEARAAGRKYVLYTLAGGLAVFSGTLLVYALTGTTAFTPGGVGDSLSANPVFARAAFALLVGGFGVKAALAPLHGWLPDAMVAPTPVSSLLHAVAVVKSGVFGIARVVLYVYGTDDLTSLGVGMPLAVLAAATMLFAAALALRQTSLKRGLAYSTVSQLSYILLGLAVATPGTIRGALLHFSAHAFMKIALFFCAGLVYVETHVETIADLRGIGRRLPATMTAFAVASAGLVGLPFVAGFVSKWYLLVGLVAAAHPLLAGAMLVAGLLKLLFFWPIVSAAFFPDDASDGARWDRETRQTEADWRLLVPVLLAVAVAVGYGIVPTRFPFFDLADRIVEVAT
jgi:multicomponent Na+:H+ antiporter subunit D